MKYLLRLATYGSVGALLALVVFFVMALNARQDLGVWHLADLDEEFTVRSDVSSFTEYLSLEERLFSQIDELVYAQTGDVTAGS